MGMVTSKLVIYDYEFGMIGYVISFVLFIFLFIHNKDSHHLNSDSQKSCYILDGFNSYCYKITHLSSEIQYNIIESTS